jgi:hypothetical protein
MALTTLGVKGGIRFKYWAVAWIVSSNLAEFVRFMARSRDSGVLQNTMLLIACRSSGLL